MLCWQFVCCDLILITDFGVHCASCPLRVAHLWTVRPASPETSCKAWGWAARVNASSVPWQLDNRVGESKYARTLKSYPQSAWVTAYSPPGDWLSKGEAGIKGGNQGASPGTPSSLNVRSVKAKVCLSHREMEPVAEVNRLAPKWQRIRGWPAVQGSVSIPDKPGG